MRISDWSSDGCSSDLGAGAAVLQLDAGAQRGERRGARLTLDLHQIGFGHLVPRRRNARLQRAVVGQDQQAFAVAVEPSGGIDPRHVDIVRQRRARGLARSEEHTSELTSLMSISYAVFCL